ncbi:MAG: hypothetical protein V1735_07480 [Nanoarchaeota archaeon]
MEKIATLGLFMILALAAAASAYECEFGTIVNGIAYSGDNISTDPVPSVMVDVTCNSNIISDETNSEGYYAVFFGPYTCNQGDEVSACVGDICGYGVVEECLQPNELNILGIDIFGVPEFSVIAGSLALLGAGAGYMFLRKRK